MRNASIIGKTVKIISKGHWSFGFYGEIKAYDGEHYHIQIHNGSTSDVRLIFERDEFRVCRNVKKPDNS